jgi:hypothetical protein
VTSARTAARDGFRIPAAVKASGLRPPGFLSRLEVPKSLRRPKALAFGLGGLGLLALGLSLWSVHRQEVALREAVALAKYDALRPVNRLVTIPQLEESQDSIHHEAERALAEDPLRAYYRAEEWARLDPDNLSAAQLLARAKDKLTSTPPLAWTSADFDKALQTGDLENARKCITALLAVAPDDAALKDRARRLELALAPLYAGSDKLNEARQMLLLGRAMFPQDRTWQARLKLLEALESMPASERASWIQLLG